MKLDSKYIIGDVREHFKAVFNEDRQWDEWRAFYNGWIDGRAQMILDVQAYANEKVIEELEKRRSVLITYLEEMRSSVATTAFIEDITVDIIDLKERLKQK